MKKISIITVAIALAACGDTSPLAPATPVPPKSGSVMLEPVEYAANISNMMQAYDKDLAKSFSLKLNMSIENVENIIKPKFTKVEGGEGNQSFTYTKTNSTTGGIVIIATADGLLDDSVKAEELIAVFSKDENGQLRLSDYGMRIKCWRGENNDAWTTELCP